MFGVRDREAKRTDYMLVCEEGQRTQIGNKY